MTLQLTQYEADILQGLKDSIKRNKNRLTAEREQREPYIVGLLRNPEVSSQWIVENEHIAAHTLTELRKRYGIWGK